MGEFAASVLAEQVGSELAALIRALGPPLLDATALRSSGYPGYRPRAFRLRFADGRLLKGRTFGTARRAALVEYVSRHVGPGLPSVIARNGAALLTEWITGTALSAACSAPLLWHCGVLQARIHAVPLPPGSEPADGGVAARQAQFERHLVALQSAAVLDTSTARRAHELALAHSPQRYTLAVGHRDFCAENLVACTATDVWAVDNETVAVDAAAYDLARTWYRWPLPPDQRARYLDGYHQHRSSAELVDHFPYWTIVALVDAAAFRCAQHPAAAAVPLNRLRQLLPVLESDHTGAPA